ncbi:aquaporin-3-like isoform X2 [Patiria miniata]|nr:aquaporin-3-like isoform X2 [Patiria miniata]XP_038073507.1 aquaporin-3-like isoform X2 [Patiria miniata]
MSEGWFMHVDKFLDNLRLRNELIRQFCAELLGTFMLVLIGDGAIAQMKFFGGTGTGAGFLNVNIGYSFGLMLGVYFTASVSGGHLNPAVSLAFCTLGKLKWLAFPVYMLAQFIGAFLAAAMVFAVYYDSIDKEDHNRTVVLPTSTAGIFATYPTPGLSWGVGFVDQLLGTALLMGGIMAVTDSKNSKPPSGLEPIFVALTFFAVGISFGYNFGYGINPARDFGPRVFTALAGYGSDVWTQAGVHWWIIPTFVPFLGAPIGAWVYYLGIGMHCESAYKRHEDNAQLLESQPSMTEDK